MFADLNPDHTNVPYKSIFMDQIFALEGRLEKCKNLIPTKIPSHTVCYNVCNTMGKCSLKNIHFWLVLYFLYACLYYSGVLKIWRNSRPNKWKVAVSDLLSTSVDRSLWTPRPTGSQPSTTVSSTRTTSLMTTHHREVMGIHVYGCLLKYNHWTRSQGVKYWYLAHVVCYKRLGPLNYILIHNYDLLPVNMCTGSKHAFYGYWV